MKNQIFKTLQEYSRTIKQNGYDVYAVMLKGSQNYNLSDKDSDIDANAIIIPSIESVIAGERIKKKFEFENGEVTCYDIISFTEMINKGNPQWIECINTNYKIGGDFSVFENAKVNPKALRGMAYEKLKAIDHPYPSTKEKIEKYGYDPKQLHHIVRIYDLLKSDQNIYVYDEVKRNQMIELKRKPVNDWRRLAEEYIKKIDNITADVEFEKNEIPMTWATEAIKQSLIRRPAAHSGSIKEALITTRTFGNEVPKYVKGAFDEPFKKNTDYNITTYIMVEKL